MYHGSLLCATTINIVAGTGVSAGTVQPLIITTDGTARNYGSPISFSAAGPAPLIEIVTPIMGVAVQITSGGISGGTICIDITTVVL